MSNLTINKGEVLSRDLLDSTLSVGIDWRVNLSEQIINLYDPMMNDGNIAVPSKTNKLPCDNIAAVMFEEQEIENDTNVPSNNGNVELDDAPKLKKGLFSYAMTFPEASLEQKEDFYNILLYKIVDIGIYDVLTFGKLLWRDSDNINLQLIG